MNADQGGNLNSVISTIWTFDKIQNSKWIVIMNDTKEVKSVYLLGLVSYLCRKFRVGDFV